MKKNRARAAEPQTLHSVSSQQDPDPKLTLENLNDSLSDVGAWLERVQRGEESQLCLWRGQSDDCRKWDDNYGFPVSPWDGSADTRVRLVDSSIDEIVMLQMTAFFNAQPTAVQQEAGDAAASGKVQTLLKYEIRHRMRSELWREMNLCANWAALSGHAVVRTGWRNGWTTGNGRLTQEDLVVFVKERQMQQMPEEQQTEEVDAVITEQAILEVEQILMDPALKERAVELVLARYPVLTTQRAARVAERLIKDGEAEFRLPVRKAGRPFVKAYFPGIEIFYSWWTDDIQRAEVVHCVDTYTETELRQKPLTDGWNEDFVDALIRQGPAPVVDNGTMEKIGKMHTEARHLFENSAAANSHRKRMTELRDCYQVLHSYIKSVDEDGIECLHEIVTHPSISGGAERGKKALVGVNRIVDYYHEGGCFVEFRREYKCRPLWESRGDAEKVLTTQWELKKIRDGRLNRNDLATNPPVVSALRVLPGKSTRLGIAPGALVQNRSGETTEYLAAPRFDEGTVEMEQELRMDNANLLGLAHNGLPPGKLAMHQQFIANNFLIPCREVMLRILALDQQFMDPIYVSRIIGSQTMGYSVSREEIAGQFDILLEFDVRMMDSEYVMKRWGVIKEAYANDRSGVMNDEVITRWFISSIDPNLADMAVGDAKAVAEDEYNAEKEQLALAAMKVIIPPRNVRNPQSRLKAIEDVLANNPTLGAMFQQDADYQAIVSARAEKYQFDLQQRENAQIGREGWKAPQANGS